MTDARWRIARMRLRNQHLTGAPLRGAADVVAWLGGVQAQEYPVARWSVGQRAGAGVATEAAVDAAVADGAIVRTHVLRDTWHFVTAEDARWMLRLTAPRIQARNGTVYRRLGLDAAQLARGDALLADALTGGRHRTRRDLADELARRGVEADGFHLGYRLMHAELEEVICSGSRLGRQHSYALFDERVPPAAVMTRDDALAELTRRFFTSHGPATVRDFTWWSSLTMADARKGLDLAGAALESMVIGDRTYWTAAGQPAAPARAGAPRAHLLQAYDEYTVAYRESRDVLDIDELGGVVPGGGMMFLHAIVLDGQVIGHWRRQLTKTAVIVETQLARSLTSAETTAVADAVTRYAAFVGLPADWTLASAP